MAAIDVDISHFVALSESRARAVEECCHALRPERDQEDPIGARSLLAFVHHHNFVLAPNEPLWGTLCAFRRGSDEFVGMASIVPDDRALLVEAGVKGASGVWAGVLVAHQYRSRGVGTQLVRALLARCQTYCVRPSTFYLCARDERTARLYEREACVSAGYHDLFSTIDFSSVYQWLCRSAHD